MKLTPDPNNANQGNTRGAHAIRESLERLGAGRSIITDRHGVIIAGNQTFKQAQDLGLDIEFIHTTGDKLVAVVRDDLNLGEDDGTAQALALADNRTQELSLNFDEEKLGDVFADSGDALTFLWRHEEQELFLPEEEDPITFDDDSGENNDRELEELEASDRATSGLNYSPESTPDDGEEEESAVTVHLRPLAIVLDKEGQRKWEEAKARLGVKRDKLAFDRLVEIFLENKQGGDA